MLKPDRRCRIVKGVFDRWIIEHHETHLFAWSGYQWVPSDAGLPVGGIAICNFASAEEARAYATENELAIED